MKRTMCVRVARPMPHPGSMPTTNIPQLFHLVSKLTKQPTTSGFVPYPPIPPLQPPQVLANGKKVKNNAVPSTLLFLDNKCLITNDAFPKSTVHCLLFPRNMHLRSLNDLTSADLPLLQHMTSIGTQYAEFLRSTSHPKFRMILGFHAVPSLPMLHMHLISMDMQSARMKTRAHYNSFTTNFFLTVPRVVADISQHGYVTLNQNVEELDTLVEKAMTCVWCGIPLGSMPEVKAHIAVCPKNCSMDP